MTNKVNISALVISAALTWSILSLTEKETTFRATGTGTRDLERPSSSDITWSSDSIFFDLTIENCIDTPLAHQGQIIRGRDEIYGESEITTGDCDSRITMNLPTSQGKYTLIHRYGYDNGTINSNESQRLIEISEDGNLTEIDISGSPINLAYEITE